MKPENLTALEGLLTHPWFVSLAKEDDQLVLTMDPQQAEPPGMWDVFEVAGDLDTVVQGTLAEIARHDEESAEENGG